MSSSGDVSLIASLNNVSSMLNRYFAIAIFIFGTIGNVLNCLILLQPTLRSNPCSLFFLVSSIAHLTFIYSGLTTRMLSGWAVDLTNTIGWLCKLRAQWKMPTEVWSSFCLFQPFSMRSYSIVTKPISSTRHSNVMDAQNCVASSRQCLMHLSLQQYQ